MSANREAAPESSPGTDHAKNTDRKPERGSAAACPSPRGGAPSLEYPLPPLPTRRSPPAAYFLVLSPRSGACYTALPPHTGGQRIHHRRCPMRPGIVPEESDRF